MATGPRVYNLFPLLVGPIARWREHLPRVAALGFDWIYLNPFHYPGFSGSLYAVKDFDRLNPLFEDQPGQDAAQALRGFVAAASAHGLRVMMDLVVNHTAKDALLVERHPEWFARDAAGEIRSPGARDPEDPDKVTEWGDLAEIDWGDEANHAALIDTFGRIARRHAELGFEGFRCDAAYKVPAKVWAGIVAMVRERRPDALFAAETLGCGPEEVAALRDAGFDYLFNSVKWWDFRGDWLFEQYDAYRRVAPSIGFPESHDTERLAAGVSGDIAAHYRLRATLAAFFSAGWMMPIGYEWGFARRLDVVGTRPGDWEERRFDLSDFLRALNQAKAATPALNEEGPQERLTGRSDPVVVLLRRRPGGAAGAVLAANTDAGGSRRVDLAALLHRAALGIDGLEDVGPGHSGRVPAQIMLDPLEARLFRFPAGAAEDVSLPPTVTRDIAIEDVRPQVDCGRHPVKREVGDHVWVSADIFREGHDRVAAALLWREKSASAWREARMRPGDDDRWSASFPLGRNTRWVFTIEAWPDAYETWWHEMNKKREARQNVSVEIQEGRALVAAARDRADGPDRERLERVLAECEAAGGDPDRADLLQSAMVRQTVGRHPDRGRAVRFDRVLEVIADRPLARFAAWYEMFPRSQGTVKGRGATLREAGRRLPEIAAMGFDVLYLLPVHPIGRVHRKGPDNTLNAGPDDPGSPYAIGGPEGGHDALHPDLGTLDDFRHFVAACRDLGMEVALDFAIQCAPDHPWVREHPEWFQFRPDGSIKYAENPPKKYQDIVNVDFHGRAAAAMWRAWRDVVLFWVAQGVTIFRVDNPHTKPVPFWEWLIASVQERHPEVIFLSEAFTRPKMMRLLAKAGFSQSYTYFTWRNFKEELTAYMEELAHGEAREYFRPNFFPTTPDILPAYLQTGGRPAFRIRLVLAATLSSVYGIYNGYELCENAALPGKEEYLHSEKYEHKVWDWDRPGNIKDEIAAINRIRRENPALHEFENIRFHQADDPSVLFWGKATPDRSNMIFVAVNLDPFDMHEAVLHFPLEAMGVPEGDTFEVEELLTGARHLWRGEAHRVRLDPKVNPAALYRVTVWSPVDYRTPCF